MSFPGDPPVVDGQLEALGSLCKKLQEAAKLAHSQTMVLMKHADTMSLRVEMARRSTTHVDVEDALCSDVAEAQDLVRSAMDSLNQCQLLLGPAPNSTPRGFHAPSPRQPGASLAGTPSAGNPLISPFAQSPSCFLSSPANGSSRGVRGGGTPTWGGHSNINNNPWPRPGDDSMQQQQQKLLLQRVQQQLSGGAAAGLPQGAQQAAPQGPEAQWQQQPPLQQQQSLPGARTASSPAVTSAVTWPGNPPAQQQPLAAESRLAVSLSGGRDPQQAGATAAAAATAAASAGQAFPLEPQAHAQQQQQQQQLQGHQQQLSQQQQREQQQHPQLQQSTAQGPGTSQGASLGPSLAPSLLGNPNNPSSSSGLSSQQRQALGRHLKVLGEMKFDDQRSVGEVVSSVLAQLNGGTWLRGMAPPGGGLAGEALEPLGDGGKGVSQQVEPVSTVTASANPSVKPQVLPKSPLALPTVMASGNPNPNFAGQPQRSSSDAAQRQGGQLAAQGVGGQWAGPLSLVSANPAVPPVVGAGEEGKALGSNEGVSSDGKGGMVPSVSPGSIPGSLQNQAKKGRGGEGRGRGERGNSVTEGEGNEGEGAGRDGGEEDSAAVGSKRGAEEDEEEGEDGGKRLRATAITDMPLDGWEWRKYGQKTTLGQKYPRNYYRCSHYYHKTTAPRCPAKKWAERCNENPSNWRVKYVADHNHPKPPPRPVTITIISDTPGAEQSTMASAAVSGATGGVSVGGPGGGMVQPASPLRIEGSRPVHLLPPIPAVPAPVDKPVDLIQILPQLIGRGRGGNAATAAATTAAGLGLAAGGGGRGDGGAGAAESDAGGGVGGFRAGGGARVGAGNPAVESQGLQGRGIAATKEAGALAGVTMPRGDREGGGAAATGGGAGAGAGRGVPVPGGAVPVDEPYTVLRVEWEEEEVEEGAVRMMGEGEEAEGEEVTSLPSSEQGREGTLSKGQSVEGRQGGEGADPGAADGRLNEGQERMVGSAIVGNGKTLGQAGGLRKGQDGVLGGKKQEPGEGRSDGASMEGVRKANRSDLASSPSMNLPSDLHPPSADVAMPAESLEDLTIALPPRKLATAVRAAQEARGGGGSAMSTAASRQQQQLQQEQWRGRGEGGEGGAGGGGGSGGVGNPPLGNPSAGAAAVPGSDLPVFGVSFSSAITAAGGATAEGLTRGNSGHLNLPWGSLPRGSPRIVIGRRPRWPPLPDDSLSPLGGLALSPLNTARFVLEVAQAPLPSPMNLPDLQP